jgi:hypothetical protein
MGRYIRGTGRGHTLKILRYEARYVLEIEFPLDGPVEPSRREELFSAVQHDLLPRMQAAHVREESAEGR